MPESVEMVAGAIQEHSKLGVTAAGKIAVHVLPTSDTIPEKTR